MKSNRFSSNGHKPHKRIEPIVRSRPGIEKRDLTLGIIPLTDCAPIVMAYEKGFFAREGLNVTISREGSWASVRDKVVYDMIDGAHMLATMPLSITLGVGGVRKSMVTAFSMDLNGNAITVSNDLYDRICEIAPNELIDQPMSAHALKRVVDRNRLERKPPLRFGVVFPTSTHTYELCYWLASAGIDPQHDVRLVVIPPPQMVNHLRDGSLSGYCVGEPWNTVAVQEGVGRTLITNYEIWNNNPEKVFGVTRDWAERHPATHAAVLRALLGAARWLDDPKNRYETAHTLARAEYVGSLMSSIEPSLIGRVQYNGTGSPTNVPDYNVFYRYAATFPWRSHAIWFLTQMIRWGHISEIIDLRRVADAVYDVDTYRRIAMQLGIPYPTVDLKTEGVHAAPWTLREASESLTMGPDQFLDNAVFDPARPMEYIAGFDIAYLTASLTDLASANTD
jgi:nitrate/nitrite transport system substrate-binding protein